MASRKQRGYFFEKTSTTNAAGTLVPGTRLLATDKPTEETFRRLVESAAFILELDDRAQEGTQGFVKIVSNDNAKTNVSPDDGFVYAAQVKQLPVLSEIIQTISDLSAKVLVKATVKSGDGEKNDYELSLSDDFLTWLSGKLSDLSSSVGALSSTISGINNSISSIQADISSIQITITSIQSRVTDVEDRVTSTESDIADLQVRMGNAENDITALQAAVVAPPDNRYVGEYLMRAVNTAPSASWLSCDGSAVSRTTYVDLFSLIGTSYGAGNGSTTFNLPDWRGRGVRGYSSIDAKFDEFTDGGSDSVALVANNIPSHSHNFTATNQNSNTQTVNADGTNAGYVRSGSSGGTVEDTIKTTVTGTTDVNTTSEDPIDVTNPFLTVFTFIKALA